MRQIWVCPKSTAFDSFGSVPNLSVKIQQQQKGVFIMKSSTEIFENMPVRRAVMTMAVPAVISQLIVLMYNLADTYFIGQTDNPYMVAGVSLILPVFNLSLAVGSLLGIGGGAVLPKLLALGRRDEAARTNMFCIKTAVIVTAFFSIIMGIFASPILHALGAGENTYGYARTYVIMVLVIGGIPTVLTNILSTLLRSLSLSKEAGIGVAMGGILNILLDPLFMFVILPEGNEVLGVGIATLLSNTISCCYCLWVFIKKQNEIEVRFGLGSPEKESIRSVLRIGFPGAINTLLFDLDYMVLDKLMSGYDDISLAAIGIVLKAERIPLQTGIGLCQAVVPIVSYSYASGNRERMRKSIRFTALLGVSVALAAIAVYEVFAPGILRIFINNNETIIRGASFLRARALATVFMFLSFYVVHLFQAVGHSNKALYLGIIRWAVLNIPMMFILNHFFGMNGLVWSQLTSDIITVAISLTVLIKFLHKN